MIIGAAFTTVVTSLVNDIIGPFLALETPQSGLRNMFFVRRYYNGSMPRTSFATLTEANREGAVTWNYGNFLASIINFLIVSAVIFLIVKFVTLAWRQKRAEKTDWPCPKCREDVKKGAV